MHWIFLTVDVCFRFSGAPWFVDRGLRDSEYCQAISRFQGKTVSRLRKEPNSERKVKWNATSTFYFLFYAVKN